MTNIETGFLRLPDGLRLRYRHMEADGPTVVLLHGWLQTGHAWRRVMPTLAASGYVPLAPDLRGCGDSDKPTEGYDAVTRMEDVRSLVSALGLGDEPVFVVGHGDKGAKVANAYAVMHPDEVAALALLSAAPSGILLPLAGWHDEFHRTPDLPELLIGPHLEAYLSYFFRAWSHDPDMLHASDLAVYAHALTTPGALRASLAPFRVSEELEFQFCPDVPLLLLMGESDPRFDLPALQAAVAALSASVEFQAIARGGYWLPEERPDPVAAALLMFFREQQKPPSAQHC